MEKEKTKYLKEAKINSIPYSHAELNIWREPFKAARFHHKVFRERKEGGHCSHSHGGHCLTRRADPALTRGPANPALSGGSGGLPPGCKENQNGNIF